MTIRRLLAALAACGLLLAACGDDGDGGGGGEYADALADSIREDEEVPFSDDEVDCLAGRLVEAVGGADALEEAGISPDDLRDSEDIADLDLDPDDIDPEAVASSFSDCDISLAELILAEAGDDVPEEARQCVTEALDEDALADFFARTLIEGESDDELPPTVMEDLFACLTG